MDCTLDRQMEAAVAADMAVAIASRAYCPTVNFGCAG